MKFQTFSSTTAHIKIATSYSTTLWLYEEIEQQYSNLSIVKGRNSWKLVVLVDVHSAEQTERLRVSIGSENKRKETPKIYFLKLKFIAGFILATNASAK